MDRKELKQNAHRTVKGHWSLLVLISAAAVAASSIVPFHGVSVYTDHHSESFAQYLSSLNAGQTIVRLILIILLSIFVFQILNVVADRMFLEARTYEKVPFSHVFYISSIKKWSHTALAWFKRCLYLFLWSLTVIGGCIKYYSYFLTPFILAENPSLSGREAMTLSRKIMDGHKKEAFVLQLSLLPWYLLSGITCGLAGYLYAFPYINAVYSEYYVKLRAEAIANKTEGAEKLNDIYLYEKADSELLQKTYKDIRLDQRYVRMNEVKLNGLSSFFARKLGLWIGSEKKRRLYQGTEDIARQAVLSQDAVDQKQYPFRLSPLYERKNAHYEGQMNARRAYSIWYLLLVFTLSAFCGWLLVYTQYISPMILPDFVSLKGPWLLTAGIIGICSVVLTSGLRSRPTASYIVNAVISAAVIGINVSISTVQITPLLIGNLIALILLAALAAMAVSYVIAPYIDAQIMVHRRSALVNAAAVILFVLFIADAVI